MDFNLQVLDEEEMEKSVSEDEADPEVFSNTPNSVPLPGEAEIPAEAGSAPSPTGASPSDSHDLEARTTEAARSSTPNCDTPKPGGPLTTRQPAEYKWRSGYPTPL